MFFLDAGRDTVQAGWKAGFCPICRAIGSFRCYEYRAIGSVIGVQVSSQTLRRWKECATCGVPLDDAESPMVESEEKPELEPLIAMTADGLRQEMEGRLQIEDALRAGRPVPDRLELLREPFRLLDPVSRASGTISLKEGPPRTGCIVTVVGAVLLFAFAGGLTAANEWLTDAIVLFPVVGLIATIALALLGPRRYRRRRVAPWLVKALRPLQPTRQELQAIYDQGGLGILQRIPMSWVLRGLL